MKKITNTTVLLLIFSLVLSLAACDAANSTNTGASSSISVLSDTSSDLTETTLRLYGDSQTPVKSISNSVVTNTVNKQATGYGTVDWSTAAQGYISFMASGAGRILVLQDPSGKQESFAVDKDETIKVSLEDGSGTYYYAIGRYTEDGTACHVDYKNSFSVN